MKISALHTALATLAIIGGSTGLAAAADVVVSSTTHKSASPYQRAVSACISSFMDKILPGNTAPVHAILAPSIHESNFQLGGDYVPITVALTARSARDQALLAHSDCEVDRFARVLGLSVTFSDSAKLAALKVNDVRVAVASH
jgi:hypothetical protein